MPRRVSLADMAARPLYDPEPGTYLIQDVVINPYLQENRLSDLVVGSLLMAWKEGCVKGEHLRPFEIVFTITNRKWTHLRYQRPHAGKPFIGPDGGVMRIDKSAKDHMELKEDLVGDAFRGSTPPGHLPVSGYNIHTARNHPAYASWLESLLNMGKPLASMIPADGIAISWTDTYEQATQGRLSKQTIPPHDSDNLESDNLESDNNTATMKRGHDEDESDGEWKKPQKKAVKYSVGGAGQGASAANEQNPSPAPAMSAFELRRAQNMATNRGLMGPMMAAAADMAPAIAPKPARKRRGRPSKGGPTATPAQPPMGQMNYFEDGRPMQIPGPSHYWSGGMSALPHMGQNNNDAYGRPFEAQERPGEAREMPPGSPLRPAYQDYQLPTEAERQEMDALDRNNGPYYALNTYHPLNSRYSVENEYPPPPSPNF